MINEILSAILNNLGENNSSENNLNETNKRKGPIVKTGPTRGQVRSRNKNGRYRAKRSDAGKPRS